MTKDFHFRAYLTTHHWDGEICDGPMSADNDSCSPKKNVSN